MTCHYFKHSKRMSNMLFLSLAVLTITLTAPAQAARPKSQQAGATIVINGDPGGSVRDRYNEIKQIDRLGQKIEIRRGSCMSSCTMFLGANNVCVSPEASFGFHGPYRFGAKLSQADFDQWSRVISAHYPASVRDWYMTKARFKTHSVTRLSGAELIRHGVQRCL